MRQWTKRDFCRMLEKNGYYLAREGKGSHSIFINTIGNHITIGKAINPCVAKRIIKENNLNITLFIYESAVNFYINKQKRSDI